MSGAAPATAMPKHVAIRVDIGGTVFRISLHTLMEGARFGSVVFQALCLQILGPTGGGSPWDQRVVPAQNPQYGVRHFVDADPTPWPCWLEYLRTRRVPFVEAGPLRARVIRDTRRAGLAELAEGLGQLVDWRREELQALPWEAGLRAAIAQFRSRRAEGKRGVLPRPRLFRNAAAGSFHAVDASDSEW